MQLYIGELIAYDEVADALHKLQDDGYRNYAFSNGEPDDLAGLADIVCEGSHSASGNREVYRPCHGRRLYYLLIFIM